MTAIGGPATRRSVLLGGLSLALAAGAGAHAASAAAPRPAAASRLSPQENVAQRLAATHRTLSATQYPVRTNANGSWLVRGATDWTSGFCPGALWLTFERTRNTAWRDAARRRQQGLANEATRSSTDLGFTMRHTFARDFDLTRSTAARSTAMRAAETLSGRYHARVGMIRSWDDRAYATVFETNIDAMMNLELLFWATANGGAAKYRTMAVAHADRTLRDLVRPDGSTWMYMRADRTSGALLGHHTKQGYATESTWSRGQAWAVYGFTMAHRYTRNPAYLDTARRTAAVFLDRLPADRVAPWDFDAPDGLRFRDSSASAVVAAALLELRGVETDPARRARYDEQATAILRSLSSAAYSPQSTTFAAILAHGTQHKPHGQADTGIMFGDYYYAEALNRYERVLGPTAALAS